MQEKNIINGMLAVFLSEFFAFLTPLKWLALCGIILIIADLRFGIMASKKRGEKIRTSRAIRRSVNKLIDYTCWVLLACALEHTFAVPFHIPLMPTLVMLIVYGVEIDSIFSNYFEYRDINIKVSIVEFVKKKIGDLFEIKEAQNDK
jgi:hypothetical protein